MAKRTNIKGLFVDRPVSATAFASSVASVSQIAVGFVSMPLLLGYLGGEGLGLWLICQGIVGIAWLINSGISSAVITEVANLTATGKAQQASRQVTSAFTVMLGFGVGLCLIALPLALLLPWGQILQTGDALPRTNVSHAMLALVVCIALPFPMEFPKFVLIGLQKGYVAFFIETGGRLVGVGVFVVSLLLGAPFWFLLLVFHLLPPIIMFVFGGTMIIARGFAFWRINRAKARPFWQFVKEGTKLGISQASISIAYHSDVILIGLIVGATASASYGILQQLFTIPLLFSFAVNIALWPAFSKSNAEGNLALVRKLFFNALIFAVVASVLSGLFFAIFVDELVYFWMRQTIEFETPLVVGLFAWVCVSIPTSLGGTLLRALGLTGFVARSMVTMLVLNLPISIFLLHKVGIAGAIWGTVLADVLCLSLPFTLKIFTRVFRLS